MADAGAAGAPRTITSTGSGPELRAAPAEDPAAPVRDASYKAASHGQTRVGVGEAAARSHGLTTADADEALRSVRQAVESGLARIEVNQALSARAGGDTQPALLVDIPLRSDAETRRDVRLVMQRERHHGATDGEHVWRVEIALEPPDLGPIRARVTLGGETVSATVSAERDETRALLDSALPQLSQALTLQGLAVGELRAVRALARDDVPSSIGASASLLSLKA